MVTSARLKGIYREASFLVKEGWIVLANHIPGYAMPPEIEGYIPDIYAIKDVQTSIVVVECRDDTNADRTSSFQKYIKDFQNMVFKIHQVNAAGCRIEHSQELV